MTEFYPSKWGHTLKKKEFTLMLEPYPGTQVIYEHFGSNCPVEFTRVDKVYPPNSTLIVNNPCKDLKFTALGEITKLVVEVNYGQVFLGDSTGKVYTKEVVIKSNNYIIELNNSMNRVEIKENSATLFVWGNVAEHVDVKKSSGELLFNIE